MSKILNYFNILDQDSTAREAHNQNPVASMAHYGFTTEEQQVVMSGDKMAIAKLAGVEAAELSCVNAVNIDETFFPEDEVVMTA